MKYTSKITTRYCIVIIGLVAVSYAAFQIWHQPGADQAQDLLPRLIASILLVGLATLMLLKRSLLNPLREITRGLLSIGDSGDLSRRLPTAGSGEITELSAALNQMLDRFESARDQLKKDEELYRGVVQDQSEMICRYLPDGTLTFVNNAYSRYRGSSPEVLLGLNIFAFVPMEELDQFTQYLGLLIPENPASEMETQEVLQNGQIRNICWTDRAIFDAEGRVVEYQSVGRDVSDQRRMEDQLRYFSLHDPLTGVFNRACFEEEVIRLEKQKRHPIGMMICDVDGLKLVNDTLGHKIGDSLLVAAAYVIKESFRESDIVARIGGDEFAVLMPGSGQSDLEKASRRLRGELDHYNRTNPEIPLSISFGYACNYGTTSMDDTFKEADNNMYREKLVNGLSARSAIVETLMKALEERDFVTGKNVERLNRMVTVLAEAIGYPVNRQSDLCLLAKFHDIGNVGIPDRILFKPGPLTSEEYSEMKMHTEIGYRIANSAPDLSPIADWILKHHEWWDGNGYPRGLKGDETPLECRILAVADAYDAMTSERPYRQAMSQERAIEELKRCAGTQFDPRLVALFIPAIEKYGL